MYWFTNKALIQSSPRCGSMLQETKKQEMDLEIEIKKWSLEVSYTRNEETEKTTTLDKR